MGYAFISYKSEDIDKADALRNFFKDNDIECWMAPYNIEVGQSHPAAINRAIKNCSCFVLVLTERAQTSLDIQKEIILATKNRKDIIPLQLNKNMSLNDDFEYLLANCQIKFVEKIDKSDSVMQEVLNVVAAHTEGKGSNKKTVVKKAIVEKEAEESSDIVTIIDKDGYKYTGQMKNDKKHGKGTLYYLNGSKWYEGDWVDDKQHGKGIEYEVEGSKWYEGDWAYGKWHGKGIKYYGNRIEYEGDFLEGQRHGKGIEYCRFDGYYKKYEGNWINDKRHGNGISYHSNGSKKYEGNWADGKEYGKGIAYYYNGSKKFEGYWADGKWNGKGIEYWENGSEKTEGYWENGQRDGWGTEYYSNGFTMRETYYERGMYIETKKAKIW